jgi:hypothetical protein
MKVYSWICLLIGFLFLIGMVSADPFILTNSSSKEWLVANGVDQATITVNVRNTTSGGIIPGAIVTFNVLDPTYGFFSTNPVTTDSSGNAVGTFNVKTKSGVATITASAQYTDTSTTPPAIFTSTTPLTFEQKIDHDSPYNAVFTYPFNGTVKTTVPFAVTLIDRWGNIIDNRKTDEIHSVTFHVHGPGSDDCVFINGSVYSHDISKTLDANGHTSVNVNLTSRPGTNTIMMDRMGSMGDKYKTIEAIANGVPFTIVAVYSPLQGTPLEPRVEASTDTSKIFTIYYTLYDEFGNPTQDQQIWINTTASDGTSENQTLRTTEWNGQVWTNYGPKNIASDWTITATAVNKNTVTTSQVLHFVNANPQNLELSITPQTLASLDANPSTYSVLSAKVVDDFGNPVSGQTVTFALASPQYDCSGNSCVDTTANAMGAPSFSNSGALNTFTATTSSAAADFGVATVKVYPGSFKKIGVTGYKATATGNVTVTATWSTVSREAPITWKNYPYLSAVTKISPSIVQVGDTIDIDLKLNGDGWALQKKPIDVAITTDRSGSMGTTKMANAITAGKVFNGMMSAQDKIGLVSYGKSTSSSYACYKSGHWTTCYTSGVYAPIDLNMSSDRSTVNNTFDTYTADSSTPIREAIHNATRILVTNPRPGAVQAILIVTDGCWNLGGDPRAATTTSCDGGTYTPQAFPEDGITSSDSVVTWAKTNNIKIYSVLIGGDTGTLLACEKAATKSWADDTGGKYYYSSTSSDLSSIYTQIAGDLQESAGVDTSATFDFGTILINNVYDTSGGAFDYVGDPIVPTGTITKAPGSTMIDKYNKTAHLIPAGYTVVGPVIVNQTSEWMSTTPDHQLTFNVGTINLSETWETNVRLRVLKEGSYTLFGPNSCVSFKDPVTGLPTGKFCLDNQSSFTATSSPVYSPLSYQSITISTPLRTDGEGELITNFPVQWTTTYSGSKDVTEDIYYIHDNDPKVLIKTVTWSPPTSPYSHVQTADLPMTSLPLGSYHIYVHAHSEDASGEANSQAYEYKTSGKSFIKLE